MARKHFDDYLSQLFSQYNKLQEGLNEFEKYAQENIVDEERIQMFKDTIKPIADTYNSMLYVKYLLDMPQRDRKKDRYIKQNKKKYNQIDTKMLGPNIIKNNESIINKLKEPTNADI